MGGGAGQESGAGGACFGVQMSAVRVMLAMFAASELEDGVDETTTNAR